MLSGDLPAEGVLPERTHGFPGQRFCAGEQLAEPIVEVDDCPHALGEHGEIASVDQDVAIRHVNFEMKMMRVTKGGQGAKRFSPLSFGLASGSFSCRDLGSWTSFCATSGKRSVAVC
jgi:hypothetical protein